MIVYIDLDADPQDIVRTLRRELGPDLCRSVGRALVDEQFILIDVTLASADQRIGGRDG